MAGDEIYRGPNFSSIVVAGGPVSVSHGAAEQALAFGVPAEEITVEVAPGVEVPLAVARAIEEQQSKA